ncbi:tryptophan synthase subunit alpha [Terrilactibacillus sp. BCM23-1]|uniref:Tryptophan synthase alpha chain n=1 Tax=Terrilactibacillus tamarindi TaxID=2599694 RepID=A0A6N8CMJ4_9BACI|nr:tryptophan synthase subunit alpha [Terrilactibacillus tamarindi]MTT31279.1 tryptophan synthase subunit alpha [Terrilactibacillus tamarindi]
MNRFNQYLRPNQGSLFIPFITAGDPSENATVDIALMMQKMGASALELGIPFSDPAADGPVIQKASLRALKQGMTLKKAMFLAKKMREKGLKIPIIIFTYYNVLLQLGEERFMKLAHECDIDGLLVPDLPFEESGDLRRLCTKENIPLIQLVAPTTSDKRLKQIVDQAQGFIYCVSSLGVTGVRQTFHPDVFPFLKRVRELSPIPIAVGFGVSTFKHVEALQDHCDGVIVGSAIVREIEKHIDELKDDQKRKEALDDMYHLLLKQLFNKDTAVI